ncbi:MAG: Hsp20/alpha crystallin family protein [Actinomycetota bacterium]|jgi:HSP20 family protein|nr:Hsp20/alpha crystallin family protein [Actinomycetota bacterium]
MALPVRRRDASTEVVNWDPLTELDRLGEQLRSLLGFGSPLFADAGFMPLADIEETDEAFVVEVDLPGVKSGDLNVELSGRRLSVSGERKEKERKGVMRGRTRRVGQFHYEVVLPGEVDADKVEAQLEEGTLTIRVPKAAAERPRKIPVR